MLDAPDFKTPSQTPFKVAFLKESWAFFCGLAILEIVILCLNQSKLLSFLVKNLHFLPQNLKPSQKERSTPSQQQPKPTNTLQSNQSSKPT